MMTVPANPATGAPASAPAKQPVGCLRNVMVGCGGLLFGVLFTLFMELGGGQFIIKEIADLFSPPRSYDSTLETNCRAGDQAACNELERIRRLDAGR